MKIGSQEITNPKLGNTQVIKVYFGTDKVWPNDICIKSIGTASGEAWVLTEPLLATCTLCKAP